MVDLALSSVASTSVRPLLAGENISHPENPAVEHQYAHYELYLSPDGVPVELGRGSMGITYLATDTNLGCKVALKIINSRYFGGANAIERLRREARTAARLRHANIATVFHLGLGEDNCFYAMEYIEGETLDARVRREGALPFQLALSILSQAARALRVAHAQHFIHRDIKPTNIMLTTGEQSTQDDVTVKIIDFGLVKAVADDNARESVVTSYFAGTPHYASPEHLDLGIVDARSDIFSLGRCLQFMLSGKQPQANPSCACSIVHETQKVSGEVYRSLDVPGPVASLCRTMTDIDPALRPQSADELFQEITACVASISLKSKEGRHLAFKQRTLLGLGALFAFASVASAWVWQSRIKSKTPNLTTMSAEVSVEARVLYAQGTEAFRKHTKEDVQRAIEFYRKATVVCPNFADAHALLASTYYENVSRFGGEPTQIELAIGSAQRAIAIDPSAPKAFQVLGAIRGFQGQPWEALLQLHRALELDSKNVQAMCDFSLLWCSVGEPQLALPWAKAAAQIEPSNLQAWHAAAEACVELCADQQAEEYYLRCLAVKPTWPSARLGLLRLHLLRGEFARARQDWTEMEAIRPGLLLSLTLKAQIELFDQNEAEAESLYRKLVTMNRKGLVNYYGGISYLSALGYLRMRADDANEGISLLEEAAKLHLDFDGPGEIYDLAAIRAAEGRVEDALALLGQAITSGWQDHRSTRLDQRFESLRSDPRFTKMLNDLSVAVDGRRKEAEVLCSVPIDLAAYPVRRPEAKALK